MFFLFQRIVLTGESGSGKTTTANYLMKMLVYLGRYMKNIFENMYWTKKYLEIELKTFFRAPNRNLEEKIQHIYTILEAFGNAKTPNNDNSSRFASILDLSYSKVGKVTGAKLNVII